MVGWLVVVARGLYLARHLFTLYIFYIFYIYFKVGKEIVEDATRQGVKYMEVIIAEVVMMVQTFHFQGWH